MASIKVKNSYSQIIGLKTSEFKSLRRELSYVDNPSSAYYAGGWKSRKYLLDKNGFFPTGLLSRVQKLTNANLIDLRIIPTPQNLFRNRPYPFKLYDSQMAATIAALTCGRGGIVMPTGTGKSMVIANMILAHQVKTLVIVPTLEIKKQLQNTMDLLFEDTKNIQIRNIDSSDLETMTDFDMLIIDECHHAAAKTYQNLNKKAWTKIYHRFFLTATFFRNQDNEQLLFEGIAGEEIYRLTYKEAVKQKQIVLIEAYYIDLPKQENDCYTYREVYDRFVVNHDLRNSEIREIIASLRSCKKSSLTLVKEIEHGKNIVEDTITKFVHGQDDESRQYIAAFNKRELVDLVGTTGVLGEGIDTRPAEYIIIAGLGKAKSAFMQQIGRGVRNYPGKESCKVILFRDTSHKFLLRHFNMQVKILREEYGVEVEKL